MPRICVTSDVHLGLTAEAVVEALVDAIAAERPDLTVIAGDVGEGLRAFRRCLAIFARLPGDLGVIAGNHDLWAGQGVSSQQLWSTALPAATREAGRIYLEDEDWRRDGIAVVGTVAWYDYSAADQALIKKHSREAQMEQRQLWDKYVGEAEAKLKAAGVQFVKADKPAFFKATQPIRDKYGAKYAALQKRILDTK